jgi:hypothetical protein
MADELKTTDGLKPGYYWVKINDDYGWSPAQWTGLVWYTIGDIETHSSVEEIGDSINRPPSA